MAELRSTWDDWLPAYEQAYRDPDAVEKLPCPNCGAHQLRLLYTVRAANGDGDGSFWCNNCLYGIHLSRSVIPEGALYITKDEPDRRKFVPNYTLIWPMSDEEDDASESEVF